MTVTFNEEKPSDKSIFKFSRLKTNIVLIMVIAFLTTIFILNAVFIEPLFELGVNTILTMQVGFESKVFTGFMNLFSIICNTPIIALVFLFEMGLAKHKLKAIIHLSFFLLGFNIIAILKAAYQQSRPIWVSSEIQKLEWLCPKDFGNPSGHSYVAFPLFEPLFSKYEVFVNFKLTWIFSIFFGIVVPFSRMYLGVHSMNQIFFGFSFGMAWILIYRYGLRQLFYMTIGRLFKLKKWIHFFFVILVHIILLIIPIIIYKVRLDNTPLAEADLDNLNRICGTTKTSEQIQSATLVICILHSVGFGCLYGFFALKVTAEDKLYLSGQWEYINWCCCVLHCMAQLLIAAVVPVVVILGFGSFWTEGYSRYFVYNAALVFGAFMYIWLTPKLQRKYKWIDFYPNNVNKKEIIEKADRSNTQDLIGDKR